jgi:diaminopimelate epimerase
VEDETLACGTGATAVAIAMNATGATDATSIDLNVEGGKLVVSFDKKNQYTNVYLKGP